MYTILRALIYWMIIKPFVVLVLGMNVTGREHLPRNGPALLVANHNSHLDTLVLLSLFRFRDLSQVRPVAAGDYFMSGPIRRWFAVRIVRIIPITRKPTRSGSHPLAACHEALNRGEILAIFPEGSRGKPERRGSFKRGVARLVETRPTLPVVPVYLSGTGKALPRGEALFVPHICTLSIGEPFYGQEDRIAFMKDLNQRFDQLAPSQSYLQDKEST